MNELTASYIENPQDPERSLPLTLAHLWTIAEQKRATQSAGASITDQMILAEKYFAESNRLDPSDSRILGWLGSIRQGLGTIHKDQRMIREGFFMAQDGLKSSR